MGQWIPEPFAQVVREVHQGRRPRVVVRDLVKWFGFDRRGVKVNGYIRSAMLEAGITCIPALDVGFPDDEITFSSVVPLHLDAPPPPAAPARDRPHPIAVFESIIDAQADVAKRVVTRLDAIERLLAYLVFALLAGLRASNDGRYPDAARQLLAGALSKDRSPGPPIAFGTWIDLARKLATLPPRPDDPIIRAARSLFASGGASPALGAVLETRVVALRNKLRHASNLPTSAYVDAEPVLDTIANELRAALEPLLACELVCIHATHVGVREAYQYVLRVLHGSGTFFRTRTLETDEKLSPRWAYLMRPGVAPLRLAPGVFCVEDAATEQIRIYFCRTLALDPAHKVGLLAIVGGDEQKEPLPT